MTRAFIAIRPPEAVLDAIEARLELVAVGNGRRARRDQWHLTVQFLGDDAEMSAVAGAFAAEPLDHGAGQLQLGGGDALGNARRARILALRLHEGERWTQELSVQVERRLIALGHLRDPRDVAFVPHLTLARYRTSTDLRTVCAAVGPDPVGPAWRVEEVVLFESELRSEGVRHIVSARFPTQ